MKQILIFILCLNTLPIMAQNIVGKWVTYSFLFKGTESIIEDKKAKTFLMLNNDQTYSKRYWSTIVPNDTCKRYLSRSFNDSHVKEIDCNGNILKNFKMTERGTYSIDKSNQKIIFTSTASTYSESYTFEKESLIFKNSVESIYNGPEKYFYTKFKRK